MKRGFSLVELSIVLVILGLLVGGILAGQSLIRASQLRAVGTEYQRYLTALSAFRDKYFQIPGDMNNAQSFWGAGTCPGTNADPIATTTCNGDGDKTIEAFPNAFNGNEIFRFWQHLGNAGLVEGNYSGVANSASSGDATALIGTNVPASKLGNAGWAPNYIGDIDVTSTTWFEGSYRNVLYFGSSVALSLTSGPVLKPEEAWNLDTKLDDGKPGMGRVLTSEDSTTCHDAGTSTSALAATANYALSTTTATCPLYFKLGY